MRRLLSVPNLFSLARLGMTPFAAAAILDGRYGLALAIVGAAALTDVLDGSLARWFGWSTPIGVYLDPITDKILLVVVYLSLGVAGLLPWWLVAIVLGRDILILTFGGVLFWMGFRGFRPSVWGKLSTVAQAATAVAALASQATGAAVLAEAVRLMPGLAAAATVWSGVHYAWTTRRMWWSPRLQNRIDGGRPPE